MISPEKIAKRIEHTDTSDLLAWMDLAVAGMMRQLDDFRKKPDEAHLAEISLAGLTIQLSCEEIALRLKQHRAMMDAST